MKRTSTKLTKYNEEFRIASQLVRQRSKGICEAAPFVARWLPPVITGENLDDEEEQRDSRLREIAHVFAVREFLEVECGMKVDHVHHRKYRSRGGSNSLANLIALCETHHSWVHAHGGFGQPSNVLRLTLSAGQSEDL